MAGTTDYRAAPGQGVKGAGGTGEGEGVFVRPISTNSSSIAAGSVGKIVPGSRTRQNRIPRPFTFRRLFLSIPIVLEKLYATGTRVSNYADGRRSMTVGGIGCFSFRFFSSIFAPPATPVGRKINYYERNAAPGKGRNCCCTGGSESGRIKSKIVLIESVMDL